MIGVNIADVIVRIQELTEIDLDTMKGAIEEDNCNPETAPYYILCSVIPKDCEKIDPDIAKDYAKKKINIIENATGISYSDTLKDIVSDFFALMRKKYAGEIEKHILDIENFVEKYNGVSVGTMEWVIVEMLKRELLGLYAGRPEYIKKMKTLVEKIKPTDAEYKRLLNSL